MCKVYKDIGIKLSTLISAKFGQVSCLKIGLSNLISLLFWVWDKKDWGDFTPTNKTLFLPRNK